MFIKRGRNFMEKATETKQAVLLKIATNLILISDKIALRLAKHCSSVVGTTTVELL